MNLLIRVILLMGLCSCVILGQSLSDPDVAAGALVDLVDDVSTLSKTVDVIKTVENVDEVVEGAGEAVKAIKKDPLGVLKDNLAKLAVDYTSSKASVITTISTALEKVNDIIKKAVKRVDMWRNTKATLVGYYKSAGRLIDDTKSLMQDFTWAGYFEIDPSKRWTKQAEKLYDNDRFGGEWRGAYKDFYDSFTGYLKTTYNNANKTKDTTASKNEHQGLYSVIVPQPNPMFINCLMKKAGKSDSSGNDTYVIDSSRVTHFEYRMGPMRILDWSATALSSLKELEASYAGAAGASGDMTFQDTTLAYIAKKLGAKKQTALDTKELTEYIAIQRGLIGLNMQNIRQVQANAEMYYANLFIREKAVREMNARVYEGSLQILALGDDNFVKYQEMLRRNGGVSLIGYETGDE